MAGPQNKTIDRDACNFPSNSIKSKTEATTDARPKVESIVKGRVKSQKKTLGKRISNRLMGSESRGVGNYVLHDVLIPAAKAMFLDMVSGGVEMSLYGERQGRRTSRDRGTSYVSYDKASYRNDRDRDRDKGREVSRAARTRHDFDDIVLESRGEAEEVLSHLVDFCYDYGQATVADFYDLVGVTSSFTDNKYGWTDLKGATVRSVRGGFLINLPKTQQID